MPVLIFWLYLLPLHLQLTPLLGLTGVAGQEPELQVEQPDKLVSLTEGQTATLRCFMTSQTPPGPVKWFRETARGRELIYSFRGGNYPQVTNASDTTKRDNKEFSIHIQDISPADTGTYYCVKFRKGNIEDEEFKSGPGTRVTVRAKPSPPVVSGPRARVSPGHTVNFTCKYHGFFPRDISLRWFKNGNVLSDTRTSVDPQGDSDSYNISSTARVPLVLGDIHSQVICEVTHSDLRGGSLRGTANLSETIRVPPTLEVSQLPEVGNQVILTCQVKKFYPQNLQLTWLENGNVSRPEMATLLLENNEGTFNRTSWLLVNSSANRENMAFTCQVEYDGQLVLTKSHILDVSGPQKDQGSKELPGFLLGFFLGPKILLILAISAIYIYKKLKI